MLLVRRHGNYCCDDRSALQQRVRAFVKQIRAKLGDDATEPRWIINEHGVGYRVPGPGEE